MAAAFCTRCSDLVTVEGGRCPRGHPVETGPHDESPAEPQPWTNAMDRAPDGDHDDEAAPADPARTARAAGEPTADQAEADDDFGDVLASLEAVVSRLQGQDDAADTESTAGVGPDAGEGGAGTATAQPSDPSRPPPQQDTTAASAADGGEERPADQGVDVAEGEPDGEGDVDLSRFTARGNDTEGGLLHRIFGRG